MDLRCYRIAFLWLYVTLPIDFCYWQIIACSVVKKILPSGSLLEWVGET